VRLALLGFSHETNTFVQQPTSYDRFVQSGILRGEEVVQRHRHAHSTIAGYLEAADRFGCTVAPLYFAATEPAGMITADAFERITAEMLQLLESDGPWDGVLLALHGAAVSEQYADADGEIAARVRALVGPRLPIGLSLDLHTNLTAKMVDNATVTVLYRTNPHLDPRPRALECAELVVRTIRGEIRPVQALETPPLAINIVRQFTGEEPMRGVMQDAATVMARPGVLSASVAEGYPYADVPEMGMAFLVVHDGNVVAAREVAQWLAGRSWQRRREFVGHTPSPTEALRAAAAAPRGPVVLMDVGDNIGGGSPGDSTVLLAEAKRLGIRGYLQTLYDPDAVAACLAAGVGHTLTFRVGGHDIDSPAPPVEVTGMVRLISDGKFEDAQPTHGGARYFDGGVTAVIETDDEHTLVLTSRRVGNTSIQQMYSLGIRPESKRVVVAKGVVSPRPAYEPIAAEIILVNTPGVTTSDLSHFSYRRRRRPLYPFEPEASYGTSDV